MKANPLARIHVAIATILALAVAGCVGSRMIPPSEPPARPSPVPSPAPTPPPSATDWRDMPATPGDWQWSAESGRSVARFGGGLLTLRCTAGGNIELLRPANSATPVPMTLRTTSSSFALVGTPQAGPPPALSAMFPAADPRLDAIAFSRGRFALEAPGLPTLYVPSWPEISRVIEDCR